MSSSAGPEVKAEQLQSRVSRSVFLSMIFLARSFVKSFDQNPVRIPAAYREESGKATGLTCQDFGG